MSALLFLVWTSARNRVVSVLRRVQSPRYAAALLVGVLYVWSFLVRPASHAGATSFLLGQPTEMLVTVLMVVMLMGSWIFGSDATALAFSQAEVSLLFPAPLTRRQLVRFKLLRAQIAVIVNALIWVFVLRRGGTVLPSPLRAVGLWVLFSTLNLHRIGSALVRSSWREHHGAGARRHRWSIVVFAAIGIALLVGMFDGRQELFAAHGLGGFFTALAHVLSRPPAIVALYPFHLVVAPTFAHSIGEWGREILPALGVLLAHAWWVFRSDAAFEEAAIEASAERARRLEAARSRRSVAGTRPPRAATSSIELAATGRPGMAILWKNMLCLRRTAQLRVFIGPAVMAIVLGASTADSGADAGEVVAACALTFAGMLLILGGRLIRNDLRHDMLHLPLLKSLPIGGHEIVLAEVASAALPMAAMQLVLFAIAFVAASVSAHPPLSASVRLALLAGAPFAVIALNAALLTIQNGTAVLFPAWIRLGPTVSTGVETLGQNVLSMLANLIVLALALIVPMFAAWVTITIFAPYRAPALAVAMIVAAVLLGAETYGAIRFLGGAFTRAEPLQTT